MKTEAWLYLVTAPSVPEWKCVFDKEVRRDQVIKKYREATGYSGNVIGIMGFKVPYHEGRNYEN